MSEKWHISPDGTPRKCNPIKTGKCQYGDSAEHFSSQEDARKFYETSKRELLTRKISKSQKKSVERDEFGLSSKEKALLWKRLRCSLPLKKLKTMQLSKSIPVDVSFNRNGMASFDYEEYETQKIFSKGACGILAYSLHQKSGLPVLIITPNPDEKYWQGHAAIKLSDDKYLDITGENTLDELFRRYNFNVKTAEVLETSTFSEIEKKLVLKPGQNPLEKYDDLEKAIVDRVSEDLLRDFVL